MLLLLLLLLAYKTGLDIGDRSLSHSASYAALWIAHRVEKRA